MEKARIQLQETPEQMLYFFLDGGIPAEPLKQKTLASSSTPPPAQLLLQHCHAIPNTAPEILRSYTDNDLMAIIEMMKHIVYVSLYHLLQYILESTAVLNTALILVGGAQQDVQITRISVDII